ncbi:MAG: lysylphosphatidylglycerol synthase transmembrane domain-containing protein [Rariglobus sp.]
MKRWGLVGIQFVVTVALLAFLFSRDEFRRDFGSVLSSAKPVSLLLAVVGAGIVNALCWVRWWLCLRILGIEVSLGRSLRFYAIGLFGSLFLLGPLGGDAVRIGLLWRDGHAKGPAALSVLVDRMSGLVALILGTAGVAAWRWEWFARDTLSLRLMQGLGVYLAGASALLVFSLVVSRFNWAEKLSPRVPAREHLLGMIDGWARVTRHGGRASVAMALSVVGLALYYLVFAVCASAFRVNVSWTDVVAVMPVVDVASALPLSVAGLGVREAVFEVMLERLAGVPAADSVLISLGGFASMSVWCVAGALGLLGYRAGREGKSVKINELGTAS